MNKHSIQDVLLKIGLDPELVNMNTSLTNLEVVEDYVGGKKSKSSSDSLCFSFGFSWDRMDFKEVICPGQMIEEKIGNAESSNNNNNNNNNAGSRGLGFTSVWYRSGNKLVKQARPWSKDSDGRPYTLEREFSQAGMMTTFSTDNNQMKAAAFFRRL